MSTKLVFVYNADSGLFNTFSDIAHKSISPRTYPCQLCTLTHGYFSVHNEWTGFLEKLDIECEFLHRDEYIKQYGGSDDALPCIFVNKNNTLTSFMSRDEVNNCKNLPSLKQAIQTKLAVIQENN